MATCKVFGCGGGYSSFIFCPCAVCLCRQNEDNCKDVLKRIGYQGKHEEYWSDLKSKSNWQAKKAGLGFNNKEDEGVYN